MSIFSSFWKRKELEEDKSNAFLSQRHARQAGNVKVLGVLLDSVTLSFQYKTSVCLKLTGGYKALEKIKCYLPNSVEQGDLELKYYPDFVRVLRSALQHVKQHPTNVLASRKHMAKFSITVHNQDIYPWAEIVQEGGNEYSLSFSINEHEGAIAKPFWFVICGG